ncbi:uncharacterized protein PHACADRAFT_105123 [Phanerochaete carnosa HHB-10118-sp]|uniref:Uncharacterized protein n=1 Tax=Phanerochaete carnosa (strain HHB-10118-sp) TaxID=650164 RepID=K5VGT1_PHACS|nr:uncharacterized protein PHACADRAFT_105123 [Phanerochaete carnosa HHB-10118-sp]EKM50408.1 hypothetical protein PHACADRAFT_105123 [Phanerochaete carnosa HHB-10118-sp]
MLAGQVSRAVKARKELTKVVNCLTSQSEIGGPRACMYLLNHPNHYTSHLFQSEAKVIGVNTVMDYIYRPEKYESVCLYDWVRSSVKGKMSKRIAEGNEREGEFLWIGQNLKFLIKWNLGDQTWISKSEANHLEALDIYLDKLGARFTEDYPQHSTHHVHMCIEAEAKVPDFIGGALPRKDKGNREDYCMTMLTLFKPWRTGKNLKSEENGWNDIFTDYSFTPRQSELMKFFHMRYECNDARDNNAAARKKGLASGDMPSNIDEDIQENLNNLYYGDELLDQLGEEQLTEIAVLFPVLYVMLQLLCPIIILLFHISIS